MDDLFSVLSTSILYDPHVPHCYQKTCFRLRLHGEVQYVMPQNRTGMIMGGGEAL